MIPNDSIAPRLMVSSYYRGLLDTAGEDEELASYLSKKINSALWLIKCINQRKETIMNVAEEVVKYQREFFTDGSKYLKPLTLKMIAEKLGIHESTVSRAVNGKYIESPKGLYELKYFFSQGVSSGTGEGVSSKGVKAFIREMIDGENPKKPYSDQKLAELLGNKGIEISRRTVAKYRDELGIMSSSKRKRY